MCFLITRIEFKLSRIDIVRESIFNALSMLFFRPTDKDIYKDLSHTMTHMSTQLLEQSKVVLPDKGLELSDQGHHPTAQYVHQ